MTWRPHITVAAVIERNGHFLMVEEDCVGSIVINQPAGHLEKNENLVDAVIRETLEETAWHINPTGIVGVYQWTNNTDRHTFIRICFSADCLDHDPARDLDKGILQALWLTLDDLDKESHRLRSPMVMRCIHDYLAGPRYPLHLLNDITDTGK